MSRDSSSGQGKDEAEKQKDEKSAAGVSRRDLLKTGALVGAVGAVAGPAGVASAVAGPAAVAAASQGGGDGPSGQPDLVLQNGRIHLMDGTGRVLSSVAIKDGRFIEVGREGRGGPNTRRINLRRRTVVPGIIDNHNHIVLMGNRPGHHTPLENAYSIADVQAQLADRAAEVPAGEFITTIGGFHLNQFAQVRLPTLDELDSAVPNHPVYISQSFSGPSTTNSLGKAFFESAPLPVTVGEDGSIPTGEQTGRATLALRQQLTFDDRKRGVLDAMAYATSLGVTTHIDQGAFQATGTPSDGAAHEDNFSMHLPFLEIYAQGEATVRLRINFLHMDASIDVPTLTERLKNAFPFFGNDWVRTGGIGEFTAQGLGDNWMEANRRIAEAGWRAEVHSLSQTDFMTEIAGFEAVNNEFDITDLRWVVAHVPFITEEWVDRLKAIGGGLSLTGWRYLAGSATSNGPPFRMIVDNGINAGMSSDGMQIAPMNPWLHMYYATTGRNALGEVINGGQTIAREEVLRLYTADNGWFVGEEDRLGTIESGKLADLVVLNNDYFSVSDEELKEIRSVMTIVDGRIVHDTGEVS